LGVPRGILGVHWVILNMLGIHCGAFAYIVFESILVYIRSTMGYFVSTLEYFGSTLEYIGSTLVKLDIMGVLWGML